MLKILIIINLCFVSISMFGQSALSIKDSARINELKARLEILSKGLKNKAPELIRQTFADDISISTGMSAGANNFLEAILQNVNFDSVEFPFDAFDLLENDPDTALVKVEFILPTNRRQKSLVAFDRENKILFVDYFDRLFGHSRYAKSSLVAIVPFRQEDRSIILTVKLNNNPRQLSFLLDTGADGMAIRKSLADSLGIKAGKEQDANIVGGRTRVNISSGNVLHLTDSIALTDQNMAIFDKIRHNLDGIIGLNLIKRYITNINFDEQTIYLHSFGNYRYDKKSVTIPIMMKRSLIIVPSELSITDMESVLGNFILDTGANYNLIAFGDFVQRNRLLQTGFKPEAMGTTVSLGHSTTVYHGKAHELRIGEISENNIPITLQTPLPDNSSADKNMDGSIGILFWSKYNLTIDLLKKEVNLAARD
ncbi:MAG: aspartyl protease family protein [Prevotellaceae bacterium]|jgi:hypothetical protein|nr:aspartyl protease family protein [Prevotellaceae bacterium]